MPIRGFRFKLAPTAEQESQFRQLAGVCRLVYNLALEQRQTWGRSHKINFFTQSSDLTRLRAEFDWISAGCQTCQQQALRDLDLAFSRFFTGQAGYPKPRRKGASDGFLFKGREVSVKRLNAKWSAVRLPKIGWVKYRDTRPLAGLVKTATVTQDVLGWHISFSCQSERIEAANINPSVGIDRGVATTLALSNGEMISIPPSLTAVDLQCRAAQRIASRRKKGSTRRAKAQRRVARLSARRARIRRDWQHKVSRSIADRFGIVVMEDLKVANLTVSAKGTLESPGTNVRQKAGLNRSILNQGWGTFARLLTYKMEGRGGHVVMVDPAYTSQTCSSCGTVDKRSRESQAVFACQHCGFRAHADTNAAVNILRRNTTSMRMEEGHKLSDEVRTRRGLAPENQLALAG